MGQFTEELNKQLLLKEKTRYHRDQFNTYMNTFEWENVEDAKRIGTFMEEDKSLFYFPFIRRAFILLWITVKSIVVANRYDSKYKILTSEYGLMALFINFFNILEFIPKGIAGLIVRRITHEQNRTNMQKQFAIHAKKYGNDLETVPFYDHNYGQMSKELATSWQASKAVTVVDRLTYLVMRSDWMIRSWVSRPLQYLYHQPGNIVPATTDMILRCRIENVKYEQAEEAFRAIFSTVEKMEKVEIVNDHVYVKPQKPGKDYISTYALISAPRYREFVKTCQKLDEARMAIVKIAGNDNIQVKCDIHASSEAERDQSYAALRQVEHAKPLYFYGDSINPGRRTCLFDVPVRHLQKTARALDTVHEKAEVSFIHNF